MGCLFWSDLDPKIKKAMLDKEDPEQAYIMQDKLVLFLIQQRKYINYFVEQSLINGLWGSYPHDVIAVASTLIARFEMKSMDQIRWKKKKNKDDVIQI